MNRRHLLLSAAALAACADAETPAPAAPFPMRRAINLGGGLEAPYEGEWGYRVEARHLAAIAQAGFDGIRLPVRWDTHASTEAPYPIDPVYMARVREVVDGALTQNLQVQLNVHHYIPLIEARDPNAEAPRFRAIWRQIAETFAAAPPALMFEPLNEPHGDAWTGRRVTEFLDMAIAEIRPSNPARLVVVGGPNWNSIDGLTGWTPPDDPHLALTAHYYEPYAFTHQNAEWMGEDAPRFDRDWGNETDRTAITLHIMEAAGAAAARGLAVQIGEFGVNRRAPMAQRALWTRAVRDACEASGVGWAVWDLASTFEIYDRRAEAFFPEMLAALVE